MNQRLVLFTKRLLDAMFYLGIALTISLPFLFRWVGTYILSFQKYYIPLTILYVLSGVLCLLIVAELRKMFCTVLEDNAFVDANVVSHLPPVGYPYFLLSHSGYCGSGDRICYRRPVQHRAVSGI